MTSVLDSIHKDIVKGLSFLDNKIVRTILIVILVIYNSSLLSIVNVEVSKIFRIPLVKLLVVIVIVLVGLKDPVLAILLAIALVLSSGYSDNLENLSFGDFTKALNENLKKVSGDVSQVKEDSDKVEGEVRHIKQEADNVSNSDSDDVESFHNLSQPSVDNGPQGYNNDPNCLSSCCSGNKKDNMQCEAVTTFTNELNAQGLNCPMGFDGNHVGSLI